MGATNIEMELKGTLDKGSILKKVSEQAAEDREYNGHQDGYSGDWQSVDDVICIDKVFDNFEDAYGYCNGNAEKWGPAIAVRYYKTSKSAKKSKTLIKLEDRLENLYESGSDLYKKSVEDIRGAKSKNIGCKECGSSLSRPYLKNEICPMCKTSLFSETIKGRISRQKEKIKELEESIKTEKEKIEQKNRTDETVWLVYAIVAC